MTARAALRGAGPAKPAKTAKTVETVETDSTADADPDFIPAAKASVVSTLVGRAKPSAAAAPDTDTEDEDEGDTLPDADTEDEDEGDTLPDADTEDEDEGDTLPDADTDADGEGDTLPVAAPAADAAGDTLPVAEDEVVAVAIKRKFATRRERLEYHAKLAAARIRVMETRDELQQVQKDLYATARNFVSGRVSVDELDVKLGNFVEMFQSHFDLARKVRGGDPC